MTAEQELELASIRQALADVTQRLDELEQRMAEQEERWEEAKRRYVELHPEPRASLSDRLAWIFPRHARDGACKPF